MKKSKFNLKPFHHETIQKSSINWTHFHNLLKYFQTYTKKKPSKISEHEILKKHKKLHIWDKNYFNWFKYTQ